MEGKGVTAEKTGPSDLSAAAAFLLLVVVAVSWGLTWPVNKALLAYAPPIWTVALRYVVASVAVALVAGGPRPAAPAAAAGHSGDPEHHHPAHGDLRSPVQHRPPVRDGGPLGAARLHHAAVGVSVRAPG